MNFNRLFNLGILAVMILSFIGCNDKEPVEKEFQLPSKVINKIVIGEDGVKWFATGKGIVSFNGNLWTTFSGDEILNNTPIEELAYSTVSGKNEVWLGSRLGATSFEYTSSTIGALAKYTVQPNGLLADSVSAIDIDQNNVKYIGTTKGLSILKGTTWTQFLGRRNEEILSQYKITAIASTTNEWVYASTEGGGVSRFKYTADAVSGATTLTTPYASGLRSDTVYTVIVVNGDHQWYGTKRGASLHTSEFTKTLEDWVSYSREDGLICDTVYAIGKDLSDNMWFGTHRGVSKLSGTEWKNFTTKDGLVANKINTIAIDLDGSVWFGTDEGISHYKNNQWVNY